MHASVGGLQARGDVKIPGLKRFCLCNESVLCQNSSVAKQALFVIVFCLEEAHETRGLGH